MNDRSDVVALLRAKFGLEADSDFPLLSRVPQTGVVQFLDYFVELDVDDQSRLLDDLAMRGAVLFDLSLRSFPPTPAFDRYYGAVHSPGPYTGGYRYCDVKFLASVPKIPEFGSYERWIESVQKPWVSELALTPRGDLLPRMIDLRPVVKPRLLRKLVKNTLERRGFRPEVSKGAELRYTSEAGDKLHIDFGSYLGQLCYGLTAARGGTRVIRMSFESLWSLPGGWDYLTEENSERMLDLLPELVEYLGQLTGCIDELTHP